MPRGSVDDFIRAARRKGATPDPAWTPTRKHIVLFGVACGMMWLHENHIRHRHLKPANILLDADMNPKISGFGLAQFSVPFAMQDVTMDRAVFMAPEMLTNEVCVAPQALVKEEPGETREAVDVYAYGICMFMMLANRPAFPRVTNLAQLLPKVTAGFRPLLTDDMAPYRDLIARCWEGDPSGRPSFKDIVLELGDREMLASADVHLDEFAPYRRLVAPGELISPHLRKGHVVRADDGLYMD
jgi:serine/threonine protein kinase